MRVWALESRQINLSARRRHMFDVSGTLIPLPLGAFNQHYVFPQHSITFTHNTYPSFSGECFVNFFHYNGQPRMDITLPPDSVPHCSRQSLAEHICNQYVI